MDNNIKTHTITIKRVVHHKLVNTPAICNKQVEVDTVLDLVTDSPQLKRSIVLNI